MKYVGVRRHAIQSRDLTTGSGRTGLERTQKVRKFRTVARVRPSACRATVDGMAELCPSPLPTLLRRMFRELQQHDSIFDLQAPPLPYKLKIGRTAGAYFSKSADVIRLRFAEVVREAGRR